MVLIYDVLFISNSEPNNLGMAYTHTSTVLGK
jgi:hypothetical protein